LSLTNGGTVLSYNYDKVDEGGYGVTNITVNVHLGNANQEGDVRWLIPTSPSSINLKKIGESYYTNVTYEENIYDLRVSSGHLRIMNVEIPSLNVMLSSRNRYTGQFESMAQAKTDLALIFTFARGDLRDKYLDGDITTEDQASEYLINRVNSLINSWFRYGQAAERTPAPWIGTAKSNLIYLFP
jgi:hypothetical protein